MEKFDETLDFFSPEGTPLRATVSLSLKEDSYQFRNREAERVDRDMPTLTGTGSSEQPGSEENSRPVSGSSDKNKGKDNWRDTALYNGVENPRLPSGSEIATPAKPPGAQTGLSQNTASSAVSDAMKSASPAFRYGNSSSLGSTIEGAFGHSLGDSPLDGLSAESLRESRDQKIDELRQQKDQPWLERAHRAARDSGVGFD
jgi:hypothetical protein